VVSVCQLCKESLYRPPSTSACSFQLTLKGGREANVDTSTLADGIRAFEAWARSRLRIVIEEFGIVEIGVEEGVDLGSEIEGFSTSPF